MQQQRSCNIVLPYSASVPFPATAAAAAAVCQYRAVGRQPIYVDLEADPKIDKDNPPDLKQYADTIEPPPKDDQDAASTSTQTATSGKPAAGKSAAAGAAAAAGGKGGKKAAAGTSSTAKVAAQQSNDEHHIRLTNVVQRTGDIIDMVSEVLEMYLPFCFLPVPRSTSSTLDAGLCVLQQSW